MIVKGDVRGKGEPDKVQALCNAFLDNVRNQIEDVSRLALIYPCAFLKLYATDHPDPFKRVACSAIAAWDCIVDVDASAWNQQKFVGHRYYITHAEAKAKYGNRQYTTHQLVRFLDNPNGHDNNANYMGMNMNELNEAGFEVDSPFEYVQIVEFFDLVNNKMYVWSPDYSALQRVYSQVEETNIIRTYQATMVRRAARQWIVKKGVYSDEEMAKLALGADGEYIEAELSMGQSLEGSIQAVPHTQVPPELETYINQVNEDFQRGSVLAPFTRGQATRATATEVTALASYSSSEIGRLARERDSMIEHTASVYISMMKIFLKDDTDVIVLNGQPDVVRGEDIDGDFSFYALDAGSTPVSEAVKKQEFFQAVNILMQLGVPQQKLLEEMVRKLDLPEDFLSSQLEGGQEIAQPQNQPSQTATIESGQQGSPQAVAEVL